MDELSEESKKYRLLQSRRNIWDFLGEFLRPTPSEMLIDSLVMSSLQLIFDKFSEKNSKHLEIKSIEDRANYAISQIDEVSNILSDIREELVEGTSNLSNLNNEIQTKKSEAEHLANLASINGELAASIKSEMNKIVAQQIKEGLERGKHKQQIINIIILIVGAILGAVISQWFQTGSFLPVALSKSIH